MTCCFSYPADVPPGTGTRNAVQPDPPGLRRMPTSSACFRYEADVPPGPRRMPATSGCFRYEATCRRARAGWRIWHLLFPLLIGRLRPPRA